MRKILLFLILIGLVVFVAFFFSGKAQSIFSSFSGWYDDVAASIVNVTEDATETYKASVEGVTKKFDDMKEGIDRVNKDVQQKVTDVRDAVDQVNMAVSEVKRAQDSISRVFDGDGDGDGEGEEEKD